ncbi:MAG: hypothetical protein HQK51_13920 [Oligoflexia bacterium]|nr:hypothetical protein [Oligoflexia bacterium]
MAVGGTLNAFEGKYSLKEIGGAWSSLYSKWPGLKALEQLVNENRDLEKTEFAKILGTAHLEMEKVLATSASDEVALQAIYRGLYDLSQIKAKTKFKLKDNDKEQDKKSDQDKPEEDKKDKDEDGDGDQDQPPWDSGQEQYKPRNKPFDSEGGGKANNKIMIETDAPLSSPLMGSEIFDVITQERWTKAQVGRVNPGRDTSEKHLYRVHTYGQNNLSLPLPLNYRPVSKSPDVVVKEINPGEFILINRGSAKDIDLEIIKQDPTASAIDQRTLNSKYTTATGIDKGLWPTEFLDVSKGNPRQTLSLIGHYAKINSAVYSPDGKTILTASDDKTVKLWDAATGKPLQTLSGHSDSVKSAVFSHDGKTILMASGDKSAKTWKIIYE